MDSTLTTKEIDLKTKMGLENTFNKVEKLPEEKKLEVIESEEGTIKDLEGYFEKNKFEGWSLSFDECREYFDSCMTFLKSFKLTPEIIKEFDTKVGSVEERTDLGVYLSAMIQTSYNQGYNNFTFEKVNADCFGALLKGQPKKPIKIIAKNIEGDYNLPWAENCSLKTRTLKGYRNLWAAEGCLAEIQNYQGENFGYYMKNCAIQSKNEKTLETIKKQTKGRNNKFKLIR